MSPDAGAIRAIVEQAEEMRVEPPRPLTRLIPPADAFPVDALGDVIGAAARAIHDRVQAPLAICSQSVLAAAALAVQAHADVQLPMGHVRPVSDFFVTVAETRPKVRIRHGGHLPHPQARAGVGRDPRCRIAKLCE